MKGIHIAIKKKRKKSEFRMDFGFINFFEHFCFALQTSLFGRSLNNNINMLPSSVFKYVAADI